MVDFDYEIQNVVLSVSYEGVEFDLEELSEKLEDARYDPNVFPGITYSFSEPEASLLIFESGTANCVGAKSVQGARKAVRQLTRRIRESGIEIEKEPEVEVQNIVASYDFDRRFPLEKIARNYRNTEYEPEVFPGLTFRMKDLDATLLIFVGEKVSEPSSRKKRTSRRPPGTRFEDNPPQNFGEGSDLRHLARV